MLCLHYYSNYVTLRIQEDDEEYSLDQIKEFENVQHPNWSDISGAYGKAGVLIRHNASSGVRHDGGRRPFRYGGHQRQCFHEGEMGAQWVFTPLCQLTMRRCLVCAYIKMILDVCRDLLSHCLPPLVSILLSFILPFSRYVTRFKFPLKFVCLDKSISWQLLAFPLFHNW